MLWFAACAVENALSDKDGVTEPFDSGTAPTFPTETDSDSDGVTIVALPPVATITAPEYGATVESCEGVTLTGVVTDPDTPTDQLLATWSADGRILASGTPAADGTTSVPWDPGDGAWEVTLTVEDPGGLTDVDSLPFDLTVPDGSPTFSWARSAMADRVAATTTGACVPEALALPTDPSWVWDSGDYTPAASAADGLAAGRVWASWDQVNTVDCHLLELTVEVPTCGDYGALQIASPWYDGIPINDNVYVVVDGVIVLQSGTTLGAGHGGPAETDTWMAEGAEIPIVSLSPGTNVVQFVVEEYASWGGLGYLEPTLVK